MAGRRGFVRMKQPPSQAPSDRAVTDLMHPLAVVDEGVDGLRREIEHAIRYAAAALAGRCLSNGARSRRATAARARDAAIRVQMVVLVSSEVDGAGAELLEGLALSLFALAAVQDRFDHSRRHAQICGLADVLPVVHGDCVTVLKAAAEHWLPQSGVSEQALAECG